MKKFSVLLLIIFTFSTLNVQAADEQCFKIVDVTATEMSDTGPELSTDGDMFTSWTAEGVLNIWITWELDKVQMVPGISIAFLKGDERQASFDIQVSEDGKSFTNVISGVLSAGDTLDYETFAFPSTVRAKYIKLIGYGNSTNFWNNIAEVKFPKELPKEESEGINSGVQIVSKVDYLCENSMIFQHRNNIALFKGETFNAGVSKIENGCMLVPLRYVVENLNGKILWDEATKSVSCVIQNTVLKFSANSKFMTVNGKIMDMNISARIVNGKFMVPLRELAGKIEKNIAWFDDYKIAVMSDNDIFELSKWELAELNDRLNR